MYLTELHYQNNSTELFEPLAELPHAVFLDSCYPQQQEGRYDIISALPITTITTRDELSTIQTYNKHIITKEEPFHLVKKYLSTFTQQKKSLSVALPFTIGAIGYFGYDIGRLLETLPNNSIHDILLPDAVISLYDWSIVVDHREKKTWLISQFDHLDPKYRLIQNLLSKKLNRQPAFSITQSFRSNMTQATYNNFFYRLKQHIQRGDCYQANLCQRFSGRYHGSTWNAFKLLRQKNPAPYAAYLKLTQGCILSLSPERFLQVRNRHVETKPIKGTAPRFTDVIQDELSAQQLLSSEKDKAENLMIVDLLRNDLGKCCQPGSIHVPKLFALESFSNVHHLVSTITGKLATQQHALDLLRHCFPGGSITGAPKIRAMEICETLEPHHRSVYCGSICYVDLNGNMDSNIAIRTLICDNNNIHCYTGGGIVYDSQMENEYQESIIKIKRLIKILENI